MADNNHSFSAYNKVIAITGVSLATAIILTRLLSSQKENHHQIYKKIPQPQGCYPYVGKVEKKKRVYLKASKKKIDVFSKQVIYFHLRMIHIDKLQNGIKNSIHR
jgi:hypothetical protein